MSEEDFIVGYTLFKSGGFRTKYQHFNNLETAKMFTNNVNLKDNSKIYVSLDLYNKQKEEIKELNLENQAFYEEMNCNDNEYISKKYSQLKENSISKDKIKDNIKELEILKMTSFANNEISKQVYKEQIDLINMQINVLKNLLEE